MTEFCSGAVVRAIAGREKNEIFVISRVENNSAYLVNGKSRPLECPKKKNFRHLQLLKSDSGLSLTDVSNCDVIKYLKDYIKSSDCK